MNADVRKLLVSQGLRAFVYGFGSILLGASLERRGWSAAKVGGLLAAVVAGTALMSIVVGTFGDRVGRRRFYGLLYLGLAATGVVFGTTASFAALALVALAGTLSTEVNDSGPFTSLEQAMLPSGLDARQRTRVFGVYNIVAVTVGSFGALAAGGPALLRKVWATAPADHRFFLLFVPVGIAGAMIAVRLSDRVESGSKLEGARVPLQRSRKNVTRLAALFATDAFGGGFVVQSFIAYWFSAKFGVRLEVLGLMFFVVGMLQAGSFFVATRLAERIGLLNVMIFTHLPSNVLLASIPLAPTFPAALALLFARYCLSQMDVPTRQAYVVSLVDPEERTAAAAFTNTARYAVRPIGPALAGASQRLTFGAPFFIAGGVKIVYDLALWAWFRRVPLARETREQEKEGAVTPPGPSEKRRL
jgi:predicted MFS family arabinose efflux permease